MKNLFLSLLITLVLGFAVNAGAANVFSESFDSGLGNWTVNNNNSDDYTWEHNPNNHWNLTGGGGGFAMADSYSSWADDWYDTLVSPVIDVAGYSDVTVSAAVSYQHDTDAGYADVTYSTDNGSTWRSLETWTATFQGEASWDIDLSPGTEALMLSFEYYQPEWSYYEYQVDNVSVEGAPSAVPVPSAIWLLGSGLAGLAGLRKKQSRP